MTEKAKTTKTTKPKATKPNTSRAAQAATSKAETSKAQPKTKRTRKPKAAKPKAPAKEGVRLPWAEIVSRVIGTPPAQAAAPKAESPKVQVEAPTIAAPAIEAPKIEAPTIEAPTIVAPTPPPTTIRLPAPARRIPAPLLHFDPEEWVSVTYYGEDVFVHGKAGIFARGTTTRLRGKLATELASNPSFRVRRAA